MNPIGLTRAEEEKQQSPLPRIVVSAPPGARRCRAPVPPDGADCPVAATQWVNWPDGTRAPMCLECALRMQRRARNVQTYVKLEPIE